MTRVDSKAVALEMAKRVKDKLDAPSRGFPTPPPAEVDVVVPEVVNIETEGYDRLFSAVDKVTGALPSMVDDLLELFHRGKQKTRINKEGEVETYYSPLTVEEKRRLFETFAKFALTDKRLERAFGLLRTAAKENKGMVSYSQFNFNIIKERSKPHGSLDDRLTKLIEEKKDENTGDEGTNEEGG